MADVNASAVHDLLVVGKISGLYGVKGWVKVYSHTDPKQNILQYSPWYLAKRFDSESEPAKNQGVTQVEVKSGRVHGKGLVAELSGYDDRDKASTLVGLEIAIERSQLPPTEEGEFYWTDLYDLAVETETGQKLGNVSHMLETGSNDVLVVKGERERLIPFIRPGVIKSIDLTAGRIIVDWDPEF
jgi:16S rRNA processing protein RimM